MGAAVLGSSGTAAEKIDAFEAALADKVPDNLFVLNDQNPKVAVSHVMAPTEVDSRTAPPDRALASRSSTVTVVPPPGGQSI